MCLLYIYINLKTEGLSPGSYTQYITSSLYPPYPELTPAFLGASSAAWHPCASQKRQLKLPAVGASSSHTPWGAFGVLDCLWCPWGPSGVLGVLEPVGGLRVLEILRVLGVLPWGPWVLLGSLGFLGVLGVLGASLGSL